MAPRRPSAASVVVGPARGGRLLSDTEPRGIARLAWSGRSGAQLVVFAMIGVVSTVVYAVLFLALRQLVLAQTAPTAPRSSYSRW